MNETLFCDASGLRLIQEFEGSPRLKARLCEGNAWELGWGTTFHIDGTPVKEGETCTEADALAMFRNALRIFEDAVRDMVTVPLNSHQFSALVAFAYNVGIENLRSSTVMRKVNENRMDDAAASFGMWIFATNGQGHKQALRGLLRRRYAEACLFLGYDWSVAVDIDAIALQKDPPESLPGADRVRYKTAFKDVLAVAQRYPIDAELVLSSPAPAPSNPAGNGGVAPVPQTLGATPTAQKSAAPVVVPPVAAGPAAAPKPTAPSPGSFQSGPGIAPITTTKVTVPEAQAQNPVAPPKPPVPIPPSVPVSPQNDMGPTTRTMWVSKRFWGGVLIIGGRLIIAADVAGNFAPMVRAFIGDGILMDWGTGVIVTVLGEILFDRGEKHAKGPMDTPKRIALMTPAP